MLRVSSIVPASIPGRVIKTAIDTDGEVKYLCSNIFSTEDGKRLGTVRYHIDEVYREHKMKPSVHVDFLTSKYSGLGSGRALLDFIKNFSMQNGCEGRFHLTADIGLMPSRIPHIFYRKYGMNTGDKAVDKKLDKFIKKGKDATYKDFKTMTMYYPPLEYEKAPSVSERIKNIFGLFNIKNRILNYI